MPPLSEEQQSLSSGEDFPTEDSLPTTEDPQTSASETCQSLCPTDISLAFSARLTDEQKHAILSADNCEKFPEAYKFPEVSRYGRKRSFLRKWLVNHSWLTYSESSQGAFCRVCVLFASNTPGVGQLVKTKLVELERGNKVCEEHQSKLYHTSAVTAADNFMRTYADRTKSIASQLDKRRKESEIILRKGVESLVKCALFLARQGLPFRAKRNESLASQDFSKYDSHVLCSSSNSGMFLELMKLLCSKDEGLRIHLEKSARNRKYISKTSQNKIISLLAAQVARHITDEIKEASYYSLMFDECTDVSTTEQMAVVVRYVSNELVVNEKFLTIIKCDNGTTGQAIADKIEEVIEKFQLDPEGFTAATTDGAGNMSGSLRGAAALLKNKHPGLTHVHCYSHVLNLAVVHACKLQPVQNMMDCIKCIHYFFDLSAKRTDALQSIITSKAPETRRQKIKDVCRTRWIERYDALDTIVSLLPYVVQCFEQITTSRNEWSQDTKTQATGLLHRVSSFEFIVALTVCSGVLSITKGLCVQLQSRGFDLYQATR
jgi:hypothetical protein